jgi:ABC-2 type transport system ATP-binding protein
MITARDLKKHYRVHERQPGLAAAFASVFKRKYKTVEAVDGISFELARGERVGFLGPNGAGKTTTLKMLAGLLHPTSGTLTIDGHEPCKRDDAFLRSIMLVTGQKQQLLWDLPPSETFELNRAVYDVSREQFKQTLPELVELLEIGDVIKRPTRQLSLGERMKCELAAALIHRPKLLFLDEPTIGLDVTMQVTIRRFIRDYNERHGATLILTSHDMDDVRALCPRVIVIDKGQLSYDGTLDALATKLRPEKRIALRLASPVDPEIARTLGEIVEQTDARLVLEVSQAKVAETVARALAAFTVTDLNVEDPPLEDVMRELFTRSRAARKNTPDPATPSDAEAGS